MERAPYNFVGNVEARDNTADQADVLVCDGFAGNLVLGFLGGRGWARRAGIIKKELMADLRGKIGGLISARLRRAAAAGLHERAARRCWACRARSSRLMAPAMDMPLPAPSASA